MDIRSTITDLIDDFEEKWRRVKTEEIPSYDPDTGEAAAGRDSERLDAIVADQEAEALELLREIRVELR